MPSVFETEERPKLFLKLQPHSSRTGVVDVVLVDSEGKLAATPYVLRFNGDGTIRLQSGIVHAVAEAAGLQIDSTSRVKLEEE